MPDPHSVGAHLILLVTQLPPKTDAHTHTHTQKGRQLVYLIDT